MQKNVYVILSHAGTITAGLIKRVTHAEYSHASICFDDSFKEFYSFGRRFMLTPLFGGFVRETLDTGMLGHYQTSQICILKIETTAEKYYKAKAYVEEMYSNKNQYKYNYLGVLLAAVNKSYRQKNHFYCSEFVADVLKSYRIIEENSLSEVVKPMDLLSLENAKIVYKGLTSKLRNDPVFDVSIINIKRAEE